MGLFSGIGKIVDKVTDVLGAAAPLVSLFNPGLGQAFALSQRVDEAINNSDEEQEARFEAMIKSYSINFAATHMMIDKEFQEETDRELSGMLGISAPTN